MAAATLLADGLRQSLDGSTAIALNTLTRALSLGANASRTTFLPDTGAAVTALAALHCGELDRARAVLQRALDTDAEGGVSRARHLLLLAWVSITHGDLDSAAQELNSVSPGELNPRDALWPRHCGWAWPVAPATSAHCASPGSGRRRWSPSTAWTC